MAVPAASCCAGACRGVDVITLVGLCLPERGLPLLQHHLGIVSMGLADGDAGIASSSSAVSSIRLVVTLVSVCCPICQPAAMARFPVSTQTRGCPRRPWSSRRPWGVVQRGESERRMLNAAMAGLAVCIAGRLQGNRRGDYRRQTDGRMAPARYF